MHWVIWAYITRELKLVLLKTYQHPANRRSQLQSFSPTDKLMLLKKKLVSYKNIMGATNLVMKT